MKEATGDWGVIIKTDSYAGNFEREMCAHCTGIVGDEDNTGQEFCEEVLTNKYEEVVELVPDDHGTRRPVSLHEDANNLVIWFYDEPTKEMVEDIEKRAKSFRMRAIKEEFWEDFKVKILGVEVKKY